MSNSIATGLVLGGLLLSQGAPAADNEGQYGVRGAGLVSCAVFERERATRSDVYHVVAGWIDGYITGVNQYAEDTYDATSFESTELLAALIGEHCEKHPETPVFTAVNTLVKQIAEDRLRAPSEKVIVAVDDRKALLYEEAVRRVHEKLSQRGFYRGEITGTYDQKSEEAMGAFQKSIDLEPTGFPDQLTLWRLYREQR